MEEVQTYHGTRNLSQILHYGLLSCPLLINTPMESMERFNSRREVYKLKLKEYNNLVRKLSRLVKTSSDENIIERLESERISSPQALADLGGIFFGNLNESREYNELKRNLHIFFGDFRTASGYALIDDSFKDIGVLGLKIPRKILRPSYNEAILVKGKLDLFAYLNKVYAPRKKAKELREDKWLSEKVEIFELE